ncbi:hypothetical protein CYLTODRAFT_61699 [Cylindrobasidium torrendii FP15055 ss-10]|uniref:Uncharacterized protein n=1 Tax=Cylindrobasidium torrendii FP15055 ss-10 TaxID=1314674 RepID=A0A0D7B5G8_9AGAR|nr:hypothetical protein CYLTODRAFT_61699 [Cylindrobasidium torrendii FP15055 ss-10]
MSNIMPGSPLGFCIAAGATEITSLLLYALIHKEWPVKGSVLAVFVCRDLSSGASGHLWNHLPHAVARCTELRLPVTLVPLPMSTKALLQMDKAGFVKDEITDVFALVVCRNLSLFHICAYILNVYRNYIMMVLEALRAQWTLLFNRS